MPGPLTTRTGRGQIDGRSSSGLIAVVVLVLALAVPAGAAAVPLGPDVTDPPTTGLIGYSAQSTPPGASQAVGELANVQPGQQLTYGISAPFDGRITRWRFRALYDPSLSSANASIQLIVLDALDALKRDGPIVPIPPDTTEETLFDASTDVPILAGERPGVRLISPAGESLSLAVYSDTGATIWQSALLPNRTTALDSSFAVNVEVEEGASGPSNPPSGPTSPPTTSLAVACGEKASCPALEGGPLAATRNGKKALVRLICPAGASAICVGVVTLNTVAAGRGSAKPRAIGETDYSVDPGQTGKAKVKLTKFGRKLLRERGKVKVRVDITPEGSPVQSEVAKLLAP